MFILDNANLLKELKDAVLQERKMTTKVLHLLRQVEARKLYAEKGFDSLFSFAVKFLGYSESAAQRRISAMRILREIPEVESKIISGELTLTNISQAQTYFRNEAKLRNENKFQVGIKGLNVNPVSKVEKLELLRSFENKSSRECEKMILARSPESVPQEKRRELTDTKTEIKLILDEQLIQKLDRLKKLWSHKNPNMSDAELIESMAELCLDKVDPIRKVRVKPKILKTKIKSLISNETSLSPKEDSLPAPVVRRSRYIPSFVKHKVWQRDLGKCQFVDKSTGLVCESDKFIEIDHKHPWALGGGQEIENLRLLCSTHNKFRAEEALL